MKKNRVNRRRLPTSPRSTAAWARRRCGWLWKPGSAAGTLVGLALFVALAILLVGLVRMFSMTGVSAVADGIVIIGMTLALVGIIQHPLYNGKISGLWRPITAEVSPFGPFINRNHFA